MFRSAIRRLLAVDDPPERTAFAFSVGVFIAFSPFIGLHTIMAALLAFAFRLNKVAIFGGTFINNPFVTFVPIIVVSYAIGAVVMGRPIRIPDSGLALLKNPQLLNSNYWRELVSHAWEVIVPFFIGGMALSVICSFSCYPLTLRFLRSRKSA
jgi:hypothetical protein